MSYSYTDKYFVAICMATMQSRLNYVYTINTVELATTNNAVNRQYNTNISNSKKKVIIMSLKFYTLKNKTSNIYKPPNNISLKLVAQKELSPGGGGTAIYGPYRIRAAVKGMVFKQFTLA